MGIKFRLRSIWLCICVLLFVFCLNQVVTSFLQPLCVIFLTLFCLFLGIGNRTHDVALAGQALCHWVGSPGQVQLHKADVTISKGESANSSFLCKVLRGCYLWWWSNYILCQVDFPKCKEGEKGVQKAEFWAHLCHDLQDVLGQPLALGSLSLALHSTVCRPGLLGSSTGQGWAKEGSKDAGAEPEEALKICRLCWWGLPGQGSDLKLVHTAWHLSAIR